MTEEKAEVMAVEISESMIRSLIHVVRGKQVMLDSDLAMLYQVETKNLNKAMKRNIKRFPEDFCFQLLEDEYETLRFQFGTSKEVSVGKGGRRYMPYVYTEQGISMLSAILRSEVAIKVSIGIMRAFVEMRHFLTNNSLMLNRINELEVRQLEYQKSTDEKFEQIFEYISQHEESKQKVFFDGQIYDAFSLLVELISRAEQSIVLIDNYVDIGTLNIMSKKKSDVDVLIYTLERTKLSSADVEEFNQQYPTLEMKYTNVFHDRFLILDEKITYHIGASMKDAGKKCFGINKIEDEKIIKDILKRVKLKDE